MSDRNEYLSTLSIEIFLHPFLTSTLFTMLVLCYSSTMSFGQDFRLPDDHITPLKESPRLRKVFAEIFGGVHSQWEKAPAFLNQFGIAFGLQVVPSTYCGVRMENAPMNELIFTDDRKDSNFRAYQSWIMSAEIRYVYNAFLPIDITVGLGSLNASAPNTRDVPQEGPGISKLDWGGSIVFASVALGIATTDMTKRHAFFANARYLHGLQELNREQSLDSPLTFRFTSFTVGIRFAI